MGSRSDAALIREQLLGRINALEDRVTFLREALTEVSECYRDVTADTAIEMRKTAVNALVKDWAGAMEARRVPEAQAASGAHYMTANGDVVESPL